jgi:four helix bundle protein
MGHGRKAEGWRLEVGGPRLEGRSDASIPGYIFPFEKLEVWNDSVALADLILGLLDRVPPGRYLRLVSQMEGAAVSVSQNIAEGKGRQHRKEFLQYLSIVQGSLYETVTLNEVFRIRKIFSGEEALDIRSRAELIDRKLNGLMNSVRGKNRREG